MKQQETKKKESYEPPEVSDIKPVTIAGGDLTGDTGEEDLGD